MARLRRSRLRLVLVLLFVTILTYHVLPHDNTFYLALRWNRTEFTRSLHLALTGPRRTLLASSPSAKYKILESDIGTIVNTGWNPREKLKASLLAMGGRKSVDDVVVVGDYESEGNVDFRGGKVKVWDVLGRLLEDGGVNGVGRLRLYLKWKKALELGDEVAMGEVSGKELDIIKHVPGLELGYEKMPSKKWYLIVDDDTYIHTPSLLALLSTLDHRRPYYLGNAVGDFRSRFGHGGSAILFSSGAMHKIFVQHPDVVVQARKDSLTAEYGDEVVAKMAQRAGIFLDENYSHHFNGEPPRGTFVRADRICTALVSFHKQSPEQIKEDYSVLSKIDMPITWGDVGELFGGPKIEDKEDGNVRWEWDFVGEKEDGGGVLVVKGVKSSAHCAMMCRGRTCLSWRFEKGGTCSLAPWYTVGRKVTGRSSGLNKKRIVELIDSCKK